MKIHETKVNKELKIDNRETSMIELRNKLLEETKEVSISLDRYYRDPSSRERADSLYSELYDTLLVLLLMINRLKEDTNIEEAQRSLNIHHEKLRNRGWIFGGYWTVEYISENRKKAIHLSEDIIKRKHDKHYEISDYIRDKKPEVGRNNEV